MLSLALIPLLCAHYTRLTNFQFGTTLGGRITILNHRLDLCERLTGRDLFANFVLHVTEEALLRSIVPAVSLPGHGLDELVVLELLYEGSACVMASLVAVNDCRVIQCAAMFFHEEIDRFKNEFHMQVFAQLVRQCLVRIGVKDGREIAFTVLVEQVGNIRQ